MHQARPDDPADGAYPILLASYVIACLKYATQQGGLVKAFLTYMVSENGQKAAAANACSAPLPTLRRRRRQIVAQIQ